MSAPARLLSVRLQGFKSFAERTHVRFGPGISAIVGPNGSGKSNLADALRWALGEQGRALRTRKSEDVIWAGSDRRPALGMADVQISLDNGDGLLPVEFGVVELGRRLFRSGENEYVLNRQRVRLRDLVDLLDGAHLAENAFLFIGQGMVDQALALRPEERRPLFEEVAGVRRHDRRRRRAEEQLAESEANLARVEDVVAELRPQVRRLAAQAQQQASRRDAGEELAEGLLAAAQSRWHAAAARLASAEHALAEGRARIESSMAELAARDAAAGGIAERLSDSAAAADAARRRLDEARETQTAARLAVAKAASEVESLRRDLERQAAERESLVTQLAVDRRAAALTGHRPDPALEQELREAEAALVAASGQLAAARTSNAAELLDHAALRHAEARRAADLDVARRRAADLARELAEEEARASRAASTRDDESAGLRAAEAALAASIAEELDAAATEERSAALLADARATAASASERQADATARLATAQGRHAALVEALGATERGGLAPAARRAGGRGLADGLVVDAARRPAIAAALGELAGGYLVDRGVVAGLGDARGAVVVREALSAPAASDGGRGPAAARFSEALEAAGGGPLAAAVADDPSGAVRALLAHAAWAPDLEAALGLQPLLPPGWLLVTADGRAVVRGPSVTLGRTDGLLERRDEAAQAAVAVGALERIVAAAATALATADAAVAAAAETARSASAGRVTAAERRRSAEAGVAAVGRRAEAAAREAAWLEAQVARLRDATGRAGATVAELAPAPAVSLDGSQASADGVAGPGDSAGAEAIAALERLVADQRATRDRLEASWQAAESRRRETERERARAEAGIAMAEQRMAMLESAAGASLERVSEAGRAAEAARLTLVATSQAVSEVQVALEAVMERDARERRELGGAERAAASAREAVRRLQEGARAAEREELEARLSLESLREQLLVELAGLGELGLRHLLRSGGRTGLDDANGSDAGSASDAAGTRDAAAADDAVDTGDGSADVARLEAALAAVAIRWAEAPPLAEAPSPGRLAFLRRRFHDLGAANPYALEEHAALAARLDGLEAQRTDLVAAVERTRALIVELDGLIASQFRATFGLLERAFDARFRQLFGGGFARLALTEPGDLASTGIEITARPPGKKAQALAMLSGGERALTAVALLFAMLEVRPVPFCVLDEVDAALDEANIGRFSDALRELGRTTQVVVITHNRGTIETADALYGVTVGDDSVSRVISLRLEEATALAEARSSDRGATDGPSTPRPPIIPAGLRDEAAALALAEPPEVAG